MSFNELVWVDFLKKKVNKPKGIIVGVGDDCALVKLKSKTAVLKSDLFIEDIHFRLNDISFKDIGMRAVARVLSDFAACGAAAEFIGVSAGVPTYIKQSQLEEILAGILDYGKKYKFSLVGGDTSRSTKLFLDVWGIGSIEQFIKRSTAKVGDYIFVSGRLGQRCFSKPFTPRLKEAKYLIKNFKINAMIDISDGFILDLFRVLEESHKGAILYKEKIPVTTGESDFSRGEDYELIFTIDKGERKLQALKRRFHLVGMIKDKAYGYKMQSGSKVYRIKPCGYLHF